MKPTSKPNTQVAATTEDGVLISDHEQALYAQTIGYLEEQAANGRELFRQFRDARVLLSGTGESFRALMRAILKMGLKAPQMVEPDEGELTRLLNEWKEQDGELDLTRVAFGRETRWLQAQAERPALVVYVCDKYKAAAVNSLTDACAELGVPVLIGSQLQNSEVVAPLIAGKAATGWNGLLDAFEPSELAEEADAPNRHLMIGNVAALETFKRLTGLNSLL